MLDALITEALVTAILAVPVGTALWAGWWLWRRFNRPVAG
jgi:hypothetical protein